MRHLQDNGKRRDFFRRQNAESGRVADGVRRDLLSPTLTRVLWFRTAYRRQRCRHLQQGKNHPSLPQPRFCTPSAYPTEDSIVKFLPKNRAHSVNPADSPNSLWPSRFHRLLLKESRICRQKTCDGSGRLVKFVACVMAIAVTPQQHPRGCRTTSPCGHPPSHMFPASSFLDNPQDSPPCRVPCDSCC